MNEVKLNYFSFKPYFASHGALHCGMCTSIFRFLVLLSISLQCVWFIFSKGKKGKRKEGKGREKKRMEEKGKKH